MPILLACGDPRDTDIDPTTSLPDAINTLTDQLSTTARAAREDLRKLKSMTAEDSDKPAGFIGPTQPLSVIADAS